MHSETKPRVVHVVHVLLFFYFHFLVDGVSPTREPQIDLRAVAQKFTRGQASRAGELLANRPVERKREQRDYFSRGKDRASGKKEGGRGGEREEKAHEREGERRRGGGSAEARRQG
eukprot:scaffold126126_cov24-Tisochrysis_lutea.AAC.1